jgi:EpsI family protein
MSKRPLIVSVAVLLAALAFIVTISQRGVPRVIATNLENLPMAIGGYIGSEDRFSQAVYDELNADRNIYRHYRNEQGDQIDLYIGYYGTAKGGRTPHNPYACLPGAGWAIVKTGKVALSPPYLKERVEVNHIMAVKGKHVESIIHWYQSSGTKVLSSGISQNIHRFFSRVLFNRNDGAFVRISTLTPLDRIEDADDRILAFAQEVISLLPEYWPVECENCS